MANVLPDLQRIVGDHELHVDISEALPPLNVDNRRIDQVFTNLVENAAKYSPSRSVIKIATRETDIGVQVSIIDQGSGISVQERPYVFEAFRRGNTDQAKSTKGAGLGLAICKGLIEAHGGRIWIEDHDGPGAIISFTLPRAA
jgi:two-component system sensor histidine kinase KdpD